jgi:uncharacterized membrane protein YciS (DUF1049 family)
MEKEKIDWEKLGLLSDEELDRIDENFRKTEEEGVKNILRYFDRIHDKLFTFNNILIAGYFALSKFVDTISTLNILIPIINLGFLIFIEYRMMNKSRFEADVRKKTKEQLDKHGISINKTNLYSLSTIISTFLVTLYFLYQIFFLSPHTFTNQLSNENRSKTLPKTELDSTKTIKEKTHKDGLVKTNTKLLVDTVTKKKNK